MGSNLNNMKRIAQFIKGIQIFSFVLVCFLIPICYIGQIIGDCSSTALDYIFNAGKTIFNESDSTNKG